MHVKRTRTRKESKEAVSADLQIGLLLNSRVTFSAERKDVPQPTKTEDLGIRPQVTPRA